MRERLAPRFAQPERLHKAVVARVRAQAQARVMQAIEEGLAEDERDLVRRARNAYHPRLPRLGTPEHRHSTAFEALLGHLHLSGRRERLAELLARADAILENR